MSKIKILLSVIFLVFVLIGIAQPTIDTSIFRNNFIKDIYEHEFFLKNEAPTSDSIKIKELRKAIYDSDSSLMEMAVLSFFDETVPENYWYDSLPQNEIKIIDINKDGENDLVFYLSPKIDAYLSTLIVFISDGKQYSKILQTGGSITKINFDKNGLESVYTFWPRCCTYPYQVRNAYSRVKRDLFESITYQTISDKQPQKYYSQIKKLTLSTNVCPVQPEHWKISEDSDCIETEITKGTLIEILGEKENSWLVRYRNGENDLDYYLVWIEKQ